jgi:hypothetical protein
MDVEIEEPHVHHRKVGIPWYDMALPVAALFVSLVSIGIAWHHSVVMQELVHQNEKLVEANSLPYLAIYGGDLDDDLRTAAFRLTVQNQGVGPARIADVTVTVNGRAVPDFNSLVGQCCAPGLLQAAKGGAKQYRAIRNADAILSTLSDQMILPGEKIDAVDWHVTAENEAVVKRLASAFETDAVDVSICYCSVFDDCWVRTDDDRRPVPVKQCPIAPVAYRQ